MTPDLIDHGTESGYRKHLRLGIPPCEPCRAAHAESERERYKARTISEPTRRNRKIPECGTYSGYQRHVRRRERPCAPCAAAKSEYMRNRRKFKQENVLTPTLLFAEMYLSVPVELQERIEASIGMSRIDYLVARFDAEGARQ